ncbi:hypothetical protein [Bradyrhizobium sp.]|uniref:hypothetical protein n=1 Tax=Bradyrhizobium sp. TaxID=376 RepID=UPI002D53FACF|nr:hypothetical protein [Bradyrhizobium sp.]HZR74189.1 hypothetical protein [Bradyrhizobium sp.]
MIEAGSVLSTPPLNTSLSRRGALAGLAALSLAPTSLAAAPAEPDPIFAAIDEYHQANTALTAVFQLPGDVDETTTDPLWSRRDAAFDKVVGTRPTTPAGLVALTSWVREYFDWLRTSANEANDRMDALSLEMEPIKYAIHSLPASSIEGLRAKALVALFDIRPTFAGLEELEFNDEVAFQRLFCAVAEFVGLAEMVADSGYVMPDLPEFDEDDVLHERVEEILEA